LVEMALLGMTLVTAGMSVGLAWVCLSNYPSISKSEVHRWVHEIHTEVALKEKDADKIQDLAEKTAWETEELAQQDPDLAKPSDASDEEWEVALSRASLTGTNPMVALRDMRDEASVFPPTI